MISIIIPVYNEEDQIKKQLNLVLKQRGLFELIIVDGGSTDNTISIIEANEDQRIIVAKSEKGRAKQMNVGATLATGEILFFLHADTHLPKNALVLIEGAFDNASVVSGSFYLQFDYDHLLLAMYSKFSRINRTFFTFGDQGLFVRNSVFRSIGGYPNIPIMEDIEIQRKLRKEGGFVKLDKAIVTSARRFLRNGIILNQLKNILLISLFLCGVAPSILAKRYR